MSRLFDVALATTVELPEPDSDLAPLKSALAEAGTSCTVLGWDDPGADFSSARMTILRSPWNYPLLPGEFQRWVEATAAVSDLWNPAALVNWNMHKRYLLELEGAGIPITPTELVERGSPRALADIADKRGWKEVVVKPAVSVSSMETLRIGPSDPDQGEAHLRKLVADRDVLVQEYLASVDGHGERALVWIDGTLTHAVRKSPRFAGEVEGVLTQAVEIGAAEAQLAESALETALRLLGESALYARIDVAPGSDGTPVLMELELIEPSLYFLQSGTALEAMVRAVQAKLRETG